MGWHHLSLQVPVISYGNNVLDYRRPREALIRKLFAGDLDLDKYCFFGWCKMQKAGRAAVPRCWYSPPHLPAPVLSSGSASPGSTDGMLQC
uniref:Uncharacterized protein n=1 Tax=Falco tinnunculus TaxID=100819 RepID=A0A8C4V994_FALTI